MKTRLKDQRRRADPVCGNELLGCLAGTGGGPGLSRDAVCRVGCRAFGAAVDPFICHDNIGARWQYAALAVGIAAPTGVRKGHVPNFGARFHTGNLPLKRKWIDVWVE